MADWVATVALGKLSDAQGDREKSNGLWAIWAPLLLLHLGGPDTITAYSLEDTQLWMRHLLGLAVQLSVAIYVILMSWKNSWFSFMSLPALVAGVIKYGERTWVLKWVSDDKYLHRISIDPLMYMYRNSTERHEYVRVLVLAYKHLDQFMKYLVGSGGLYVLGTPPNPWVVAETNTKWDALEVEMGLMYDLLYTKAAVIYSKGGFIMRCFSFGCTLTVLIGLTVQIVRLKTRGEDDEGNWHEIDIAITGVLILGAVALEIYAAVVIFSSNWMMLWLIKQGRGEWVIWLSDRFPELINKKKNWSRMMGRFDLLGYLLKIRDREVRSPISKLAWKVLGRNYEDKWNRYQHQTVYSVHPLVYNAISELCDPYIDSRISDSLTRELDEVWAILKDRNETGETFFELTLCVHMATEICYRLEMEWDAGGEDDPSGSDSSLWKQNREVSKALSDYMMYLLVMHPSLFFNEPKRLTRDARDINAACRNLLSTEGYEWSWSRIVERLKGKEKPKRWEIIKLLWLWTLPNATRGEKGYGQRNSHFQQLRQGGELLTLIWFINPPYTTRPPRRPPYNIFFNN
ncbi:hypothetical protein RHGRI_000188 [Rhododendron griersonianum]|uniref:DUF4220 domain-containing protein n=1 Tax=Rhododendron griersonianum TaxID=479676 RepID=A0AAV6LIN3_9ERIC|nr:hypothetical protein RHGRI_000188 [Rhododendron griersonianum]